MNVNHKKEAKMNLAHVRNNKKITQCKLAQLLEVDQSTVSKWERNVTSPSLPKLLKLTKILDCTIDDLIKEGK